MIIDNKLPVLALDAWLLPNPYLEPIQIAIVQYPDYLLTLFFVNSPHSPP